MLELSGEGGSMPRISSYEPAVLGCQCISMLELSGGGGGYAPYL